MMAPSEGVIDSAEWHTFLTQPSTYIHTDHLFAIFAGSFSRDLCKRLAAEPRLQERLSSLIQDHFRLSPWIELEACSIQDRAIAMLPLDGMYSLVRRAGAIYWSASIAAVVLGRDIVALYEALGESLCAQVIRHRDLAGPIQAFTPFDTLAQRIDADGQLCLAAWCAVQPAGVSARMTLKWQDAEPPAEDALERFADLGPAITRRAMQI